jgi:hypothetical protein
LRAIVLKPGETRPRPRRIDSAILDLFKYLHSRATIASRLDPSHLSRRSAPCLLDGVGEALDPSSAR